MGMLSSTMSSVADAVEVLHQRPQAVAVGPDQHGAPRPQVGGDRSCSSRGGGAPPRPRGTRRAAAHRAAPGGSARRGWGSTRCRRGSGRRDVVAASPHLHLVGAVRAGRLGLVAAREVAVVTLVEAPVAPHRDPRAAMDETGQVRSGSPGSAATCGPRRRAPRARPSGARPGACGSPSGVRSASNQPVNRLSLFHSLWPWRNSTSRAIRAPYAARLRADRTPGPFATAATLGATSPAGRRGHGAVALSGRPSRSVAARRRVQCT